MGVAAKKSDLTGRIAVAVPLAAVAGLCLSSKLAWNGLLLCAIAVIYIELSLAGFHARDQGKWAAAFSCAFLFALLGAGLFAAQSIREAPSGLAWLLIIMVGVIATDVGAYFGGRKFGKPRTFFPRLSPNKSAEGAAIGLVSGWVVGLAACEAVFLLDHSFTAGIAGGIIVFATPFVAIAGDLLESGTKRLCGVKDFTIAGRRVLGPHGGVADRIDALAPAWAMTYLVLLLSGNL